MYLFLTVGITQARVAAGQCFSDPATNTEWAQLINGDDTSTEFSVAGSCCQETVCGLPCAEEVPPPAKVRTCGRVDQYYTLLSPSSDC